MQRCMPWLCLLCRVFPLLSQHVPLSHAGAQETESDGSLAVGLSALACAVYASCVRVEACRGGFASRRAQETCLGRVDIDCHTCQRAARWLLDVLVCNRCALLSTCRWRDSRLLRVCAMLPVAACAAVCHVCWCHAWRQCGRCWHVQAALRSPERLVQCVCSCPAASHHDGCVVLCHDVPCPGHHCLVWLLVAPVLFCKCEGGVRRCVSEQACCAVAPSRLVACEGLLCK
jgi:hypothetical protein